MPRTWRLWSAKRSRSWPVARLPSGRSGSRHSSKRNGRCMRSASGPGARRSSGFTSGARGRHLGDIARMFAEGSRLGRLASGLATDKTEVTGEDGGAIRVEFEAALKKVYGRKAAVVDVEASRSRKQISRTSRERTGGLHRAGAGRRGVRLSRWTISSGPAWSCSRGSWPRQRGGAAVRPGRRADGSRLRRGPRRRQDPLAAGADGRG